MYQVKLGQQKAPAAAGAWRLLFRMLDDLRVGDPRLVIPGELLVSPGQPFDIKVRRIQSLEGLVKPARYLLDYGYDNDGDQA
jgi:hypothetical protein